MVPSQAKSERLMNLVICLLVSRGYVPKSKIRQVVGGYGEQSDEAFERMFERDKEELRELASPSRPDPTTRPVTTSRVTTSGGRSSNFPRSDWSPTRRLCSAWPPGYGSTRAWPKPPAERC
jgi:hypothetical protein